MVPALGASCGIDGSKSFATGAADVAKTWASGPAAKNGLDTGLVQAASSAHAVNTSPVATPSLGAASDDTEAELMGVGPARVEAHVGHVGGAAMPTSGIKRSERRSRVYLRLRWVGKPASIGFVIIAATSYMFPNAR